MPYLIDGHNLIPKLGLHLDSPDDELALVAILQDFLRLARSKAEVYFDGAPAGQARTRGFGAVTAQFVRLGTPADAAIQARLRKLGRAARNWIVVSSDHEVQNAARAAQAEALSSDEFAKQLKTMRHRHKLDTAAKKSAGDAELSSEELNEWLRLFDNRD